LNILIIKQLTLIWHFLLESSFHYFLNIMMAITTVVIGWWFSSLLSNMFDRAMVRISLDATLRPVLRSMSLWFVRLITLVSVLSQFGVQTASIFAVLGAASLALGLALQGTLQNIAAGMMLLFLRPFQLGEYISNGNIEGTVDEIGLFSTKLTRADGVCLFLPNNQLWNNTLTNFSRHSTRRIDMPIAISCRDNLSFAINALQKLVSTEEKILVSPSPLIIVNDYSAGVIMLNLRVWTTTSEFWPVRWWLAKSIYSTLAESGFSIAYPARELHIFQESSSTSTASSEKENLFKEHTH
jgi:small-conductance mechanosensitive channel